jgi:2-oxoisovalerate dehydrogenase E1 component
MHLFAPEFGLMGTSGIVGPSILQAAGAGYTFRLLQKKSVAVAFFGDGAVNNGAFHEGLNLAGIWKLPVVFVCENNQFATEIPFAYSAGNPSVAARGASYGIPGIEVDGNDALAIYEVAGDAVKRARSGGGPTLLECQTYRTRPHAEGMGDYTYRSREEVEEWKERCPLLQVRKTIQGSGKWGQGSGVRGQKSEVRDHKSELDKIDEEIVGIVGQAHAAAEKAAWPEASTAATHVYSGNGAPVFEEPSRAGHREVSFMKATHEALAAAMARDPGIFVLGEGIGKRGGNFKTTEGLFDLYGPERLRDTPISERGFVGLACGAAMTGSRPVVDFMFADFILDAAGETVNQIAKMQYMSSGRIRMPILLRGCIGIGHSAATHHSGNHYPLYAHFPGLRVVVPSSPFDAKGLLARALSGHDPVLFLEHRELLGTKGPVPEAEYEIEFGKAAVVREGRAATVVSLALMVRRTLEACARLSAQGISVEVIDPRTVSPLDTETILQSIHKTGRLLIVDEAFAPFGLGAEVAARIADLGFNDLDAPIRRLHGTFTPTPYSPALERAVVPQVDDIERALRDLLAE